MHPLGIDENTPEPFRARNQEQLNDLLKRYDEQFEKDLTILPNCVIRASIRSDDTIIEAESAAVEIRDRLLNIA